MGYFNIGRTTAITITLIGLMCCLLTTAAEQIEQSQALNNDLPAEQAFVDILISDYFKVEQNLWMLIENRADNVLLQVYKTHERFLNETINRSGSGALVRHLVPNRYIEPLISLGLSVNSTAELGYSYLREQSLDRKSITQFANYSLKFLKDASEMFDFTSKDVFWETVGAYFKNGCLNNKDTVESSHQVIFDFYRDIQSGLLKSYITAQMSYMILGYYNSRAYREELDILRSTFEQRFARIRQMAKQHLKNADKLVYKCDTKVNNVHSSYVEITNFLQGFVDNEANLNAGSSCSGTCTDFRQTRHYQCQSGSLCDRSMNDHDAAKCNGIIRHCQEIDDSDIDICETGDPNRRYNYIKYSDGRTAGNANAVCHGRLRAESWIRWFVKCSNCICLCDDNNGKKSDRYFSLREVVSNIADNKIVTGVLLTKQNGVIHLAISERTLLPFGQAETTSSFYDTWKATYDFFTVSDIGIQENVDYFALTYENRSINLDVVTVPNGHLVSGVRFRTTPNGHITLDVRATEFDFISGKLKNQANSVWISNPNCGEKQILLQKATNPLDSVNASLINRMPNGFIKFGPTDYWSDVSQLTVPFLDTQRVEPYNPVPLSGVGLYHKAAEGGSGGFIGPKLVVYDFESYILEDSN